MPVVGRGCRDSTHRAATPESNDALATTASPTAAPVTTATMTPGSSDVKATTALSSATATTVPSFAITTTEADALQRLEFERLPVLATPSCEYGANGKWLTQPRSRFAPIAESVVRAWNPGDGHAPDSCVHLVRTHCAPDLDDQPGDEVIAEVRYFVPPMTTGDTTSAPLRCGSKERYDKGILVVLSPPSAERAEWVFKATLGWTSTGPEVEGGYSLAINHFVQLPNGRRGVFVHAINPGFSDEFEQVLEFGREDRLFRTLAPRPVPPERRRQRE